MAHRKPAKPNRGSSVRLMARLDAASKRAIVQAAKLRRVSVSDYVRTVIVAQARREVDGARDGTINMSPDEQLAFWTALNEVPVLTEAQSRLAEIMRTNLDVTRQK